MVLRWATPPSPCRWPSPSPMSPPSSKPPGWKPSEPQPTAGSREGRPSRAFPSPTGPFAGLRVHPLGVPLLRGLPVLYSGQLLSYTRLGQLQNAGNTVTLAHYLELLEGAGLLGALQKYAAEPFQHRASSPKLRALNTGQHRSPGAFLGEVDFVLKKGKHLLALQDQSAPSKRTKGLEAFTQALRAKALLLGPGGIPLETFLRENPLALLQAPEPTPTPWPKASPPPSPPPPRGARRGGRPPP